jgi:hypothetical protein
MAGQDKRPALPEHSETLPAPEFLPVLWAVADLASICAGLD